MQESALHDNAPASEPLERREYDASQLTAQHPPRWHHRNKGIVHEIACPPDLPPAGTIGYTRWRAMPLPPRIDPLAGLPLLEVRPDVYDYVPVADLDSAVEWHVNFADPHLFVACEGPLFAQDEMQVSEHPALASLKQALVAEGLPARTVEGDQPTPVLVTGVERRCHVETAPNAAAGRPFGLYGNNFARADEATLRRATTPIRPPTTTNLVAIAALPPAFDEYTAEQVEYTLVTAYTGFRAAVLEAARLAPGAPVVVHSGFWGCGAFGGNRVLMPALQVLAAGMAGIDRLVFHAFDRAGIRFVDEATSYVRDKLGTREAYSPADLVDTIVAAGFEWGVSDGN